MSGIDMSVENMTNVSFSLFAAAGFFAVTAVVLFFTLDIAKCWRMVTGMYVSHRVYREMRQKIGGTAHSNNAATKKLQGVSTEKISRSELSVAGKEIFSQSQGIRIEEEPVGETVLLECEGEQATELLGTIGLEMIQDIVYMQDTTDIS